jgi:tetratricopeptide (TPR) repeat protein
VVLILGAGLALSQAAVAAPSAKDKMVAALLGAAQKAFDAGEFERAGEIYLDLWRQDSTQPLYLYNAGRARHLGGQLDSAEDLYRQLLALPGLDQARIDKTRGYLVEVQRRKGERKAEEAAKVERDGKYDAAAALWRDAFDLDPNRHAWLARAGRSMQLAGKKDEAAAAYQKYLAAAPKDASDRSDVVRWFGELKPGDAAPSGGGPGAAAPVGGNAPAVGVGAQGAASKTPIAAWIALGGGGALVAGGAAMYLLALGDQDQLQKDLDASAHTVGGKTVYKLDYAAIRDRNDAIAQGKTIGVALTGAGVAAACVGVWLVLSEPKSGVAVAPALDLRGVRAAWRF